MADRLSVMEALGSEGGSVFYCLILPGAHSPGQGLLHSPPRLGPKRTLKTFPLGRGPRLELIIALWPGPPFPFQVKTWQASKSARNTPQAFCLNDLTPALSLRGLLS